MDTQTVGKLNNEDTRNPEGDNEVAEMSDEEGSVMSGEESGEEGSITSVTEEEGGPCAHTD